MPATPRSKFCCPANRIITAIRTTNNGIDGAMYLKYGTGDSNDIEIILNTTKKTASQTFSQNNGARPNICPVLTRLTITATAKIPASHTGNIYLLIITKNWITDEHTVFR